MTDSDFHPPDQASIAETVSRALAEDRAQHDVTSRAVIPAAQHGRGSFVMRESGVICGTAVVRESFAQRSPELTLEVLARDGSLLEAGTTIAIVEGPLRSMLSGERVALNFLQRLSGVASVTRRYVLAAREGGAARVIDTRKTTPGLRDLQRYAVRAGGGANHRNTLEDGILIKDNHIAAAAMRGLSIAALIEQARAGAPHTLRVEIEVDDAAGALLAIAAQADVILLDNMTPDEMRQIVEAAPEGILFEASGNVTLDTITAVAASGVDLISVGALTHSSPSLDIGLDMEAL